MPCPEFPQAQYRESGVLLWRGFGYDNIMNQCFGTYLDVCGKGKQMPVVSSGRLPDVPARTDLIRPIRPAALWIEGAPLPHYLVAAGNANPTGSGRGLRAEA